MEDINRFAPPTAEVRDAPVRPASGIGPFSPEGRSCPALSGWRWYGTAWRIFKVSPLTWWGALLLTFGLIVLAAVIPLLNLLTMFAFPLVMAGLGSCAGSIQREGRFRIGQVFDGFRRRPGALLLSGLLGMLLFVLGLALVVLLSGAGSWVDMFVGGFADRQAASQQFFKSVGLTFVLAYVALVAVYMSAVTFAPYLIHEQGMSAVQALVASFKASFKNVPAGLIAILSYFVLAIAATIPVGLGWLALMPVLFLLSYAAYAEIFFAPATSQRV